MEASGATELQELKRRELLRRTGLPARDLRRIDPALSLTTSAPSLLVSDQVLLINLGQVRLIVANDHALLFEPRSPTARHFLEGALAGCARRRPLTRASRAAEPPAPDARGCGELVRRRRGAAAGRRAL